MSRQAIHLVMGLNRVASVLPTVAGCLLILTANLIQQDERDQKGGKGNPYALGHYLEAKGRVESDMAPVLNSSDPEDLLALVASLTKKFHLTYMPGVRKTIKAITAYIESGTAPKYPLSPGLAQKIKEEKAKARSDRAESQAAKSQNKGI